MRIAPWPIVVASIEQNKERIVLDEQLALLNHIASIRELQRLSEMIEEDKLAFAGKHTAKHDPSIYKFDVEWFASTKSAKAFHNLIATSCTDLDVALKSYSPRRRSITYEALYGLCSRLYYVHLRYSITKKQHLAPATRLLGNASPRYFHTGNSC